MGIAFEVKEGFAIITPKGEADFKAITQNLKNLGFSCTTRTGRNGKNFVWKKDGVILAELEIIFEDLDHDTVLYRKNDTGLNEKLTPEKMKEILSGSVAEMLTRSVDNPAYHEALERARDTVPNFTSTEQEVLNRLALSMATKSISQAEQSLLRTSKNLLPLLKTLAELVQSKGITKFSTDHYDFLDLLDYGITQWLKQSYEEARSNGDN